MIGPQRTARTKSKRLTTAGLIAVTAATLLMMAWAISPRPRSPTVSLPWSGQGVTNGHLQQCNCAERRTFWVFTDLSQRSTAATLTREWADVRRWTKRGGWSIRAVSPGRSEQHDRSANFKSPIKPNTPILTLSHCDGVGRRPLTTEPTTTTTGADDHDDSDDHDHGDHHDCRPPRPRCRPPRPRCRPPRPRCRPPRPRRRPPRPRCRAAGAAGTPRFRPPRPPRPRPTVAHDNHHKSTTTTDEVAADDGRGREVRPSLAWRTSCRSGAWL